jgi:hypothetical protein
MEPTDRDDLRDLLADWLMEWAMTTRRYHAVTVLMDDLFTAGFVIDRDEADHAPDQ